MAQNLPGPARPRTSEKSSADASNTEASIPGPKEAGPSVEAGLANGPEYVTGFKLALVIGSLALACFLMLLDTMIISTVSIPLT